MKMVYLFGVAGDDVSTEAQTASVNTGLAVSLHAVIYPKCVCGALLQTLNIYIVVTEKITGADNIY